MSCARSIRTFSNLRKLLIRNAEMCNLSRFDELVDQRRGCRKAHSPALMTGGDRIRMYCAARRGFPGEYRVLLFHEETACRCVVRLGQVLEAVHIEARSYSRHVNLHQIWLLAVRSKDPIEGFSSGFRIKMRVQTSGCRNSLQSYDGRRWACGFFRAVIGCPVGCRT
jgi:hypothetical protein